MPSFMEWRYCVEVETGPDEWRSVDTYDDKDQAIKAAKEDTRKTRVRQFKVTTFRDEVVPAVAEEPRQSIDTVPMVPFFCPVHPTRTANAYATSGPRCPDCKQEMFQGEPAEIQNI